MWALLKGSGRAVLLGILFFHGMLSSVGDEAGSKEVKGGSCEAQEMGI